MSTLKERFGKRVQVAWRPVAGLIGLVVLVMWSSGLFENKVKPGKLEALPGFAVPAQARTVTVKVASTPSLVEVVGAVAPAELVNLSARLPAAIQTMKAAAGDVVIKGQILATLDDRELREQMAGAESQLRQAEAEYARARQLFDKAATTDQARLAALTQLEAARSHVEQLRVMLSYTVVTAPFNGVITDRRMEAGDLAAPGVVLMSVYDPTRMRFEVPVPVRLLSRFTLNRELAITLDGVDTPLQGRVTEIVGEVDPLSRTRKVRLVLVATPAPLMPGTYGHIVVEGAPHDSLWVPATSIYRVGQQEFAQVVSEGRVTRRIVRTGDVRDGEIEVLSGLNDGEILLLEPVKEG